MSTSSTPTVGSLFALPDTVLATDFVVELAKGVEQAATTVEDYVVTDDLLRGLGDALRLVGRAVESRTSAGTYLHGSFGSGKSHFLVMLSLLMDGAELAWKRPELHALRKETEDKAGESWVGKARLLQLRLHMLGKDSLEGAVFEGYIAAVRERFPQAPIPPLFADAGLFADAARVLETTGDEAFFARMNGPAVGELEEWGEFGAGAVWDRARFETCATSTDVTKRAELFSDLVRSWFPAYADSRAFVDFDIGLSRMTAHAKALGFDAVVLLLDELILWMSGLASTPAKLQAEAQKLPKLVEGQEPRHVPIVSFIARQRDLAEMVGERLAGHEHAMLAQQLEFSRGRFGTIELRNQNLPMIVEKRVLRPRSEEARKSIDRAFGALQRDAGEAWSALRTGDYRDEDFRKLYPFSPALVEALVALSDMLQRQRTAIKLLVEMLIHHVGDLPVGRVVPVGDLFDLLAGGEEPMDGVMRARFQAAKRLYQFTLLDRLRERHGTDSEEKCQRKRNGHPPSRGCAGCPQTACRNDNRLLKTLLLAALVPEAKPFKNLTVSRLVQLNHGAVRSLVPGDEVAAAVQRLEAWGAQVNQIHLGHEADPSISVQLDGIDLAPVLKQAEHLGGPGAQAQVLRDLLFSLLGVDNRDSKGLRLNEAPLKFNWRGTDRRGRVRFGNVRTMDPEALRCGSDEDFRVVLDYPFDEDGYGPADDLAVVDKMTDVAAGSWTVVWLPSFLSKKARDLLGELAIVMRILEGDPRTYLKHLAGDLQERAISDLKNLREQKKRRLDGILHQAYGLANAAEGDLDPARLVEGSHLHVLQPGKRIRPTLAHDFKSMWNHVQDAVLIERYPRHPALDAKLSSKGLADRMVELFARLVDTEEKRLSVESDQLKEVRATLAPLNIVSTIEGAVLLKHDGLLQQIEQRRQQKGESSPTAGQVRAWIDEPRTMGLERAAEDVVLRAYARLTARTFRLYGKPLHPAAGTVIPEDAVLEQPALPDAASWTKALDQAAQVFGANIGGRALHAENLDRFGQKISEAATARATAATRVMMGLDARLSELGLDAACDRRTTAASAKNLCDELLGKSAIEQIATLAKGKLETSPEAVQRSMAHGEATATVLDDKLLFGVFRQLAAMTASEPKATKLLDEVRKVLRQDELHAALAERLRTLAAAGQAILEGERPPPPPPQPAGQRIAIERHQKVGNRAAAATALAEAMGDARQELAKTTGRVTLTVAVTLDVDDEDTP